MRKTIVLLISGSLSLSAIAETSITPNDETTVFSGVSQGENKIYSFTKNQGKSYRACLQTTSGDADLYGHYLSDVSPSNYDNSSTKGGTAADCFEFNPNYTGQYYLDVYGYRDSFYELYVEESTPINENTGTKQSGSVSLEQFNYYKVTAKANWRYSACIKTTYGDADIYGRSSRIPFKTQYSVFSNLGGTKSDCISFDTDNAGNYYVGVYGYKSSDYQIYVVGASMDAPSQMQGKLNCPLKGNSDCGTPTTSKFSPFVSPWGNSVENPFFDGNEDTFHVAVDWTATAGSSVYSVYDGTLKRVGNGGSEWGYYIVIEHNINGFVFTATYMHLDKPPWAVGDYNISLSEDTYLGDIFDMSVPGESDHLHFSIHTGAQRASDINNGYQIRSHGGAVKFNKGFPQDFINPDDKSLYK